MPPRADVVAAGAVITRRGPGRVREVLVVHRPKYDDWSFPKGKRDRGEHVTATAVREVGEETGLRITLGRPLPTQVYPVSRGTKEVFYWTGRVHGSDDVAAYRPNDEVDQVRWVDPATARSLLSYPADVDLLNAFADHPARTHALVVARHAAARPRRKWDGPDPGRPLTNHGRARARALAPVLAAFGVTRVVSSPSLRCLETVTPYLERVRCGEVEPEPGLSEEGVDPATISAVVGGLLDAAAGSVVCTHRPVLPLVLDTLGVAAGEPLSPGEVLVCHHRKGRVRAVERHLA